MQYVNAVKVTGNGSLTNLRSHLQEELKDWNTLPSDTKRQRLSKALSEAKEAFASNYNLTIDNPYYSDLPQIDESEISDQMMLQGISRFLSEGELRIDGIANVLLPTQQTDVIDDFLIPILGE